jgi:hypothetical protein
MPKMERIRLKTKKNARSDVLARQEKAEKANFEWPQRALLIEYQKSVNYSF